MFDYQLAPSNLESKLRVVVSSLSIFLMASCGEPAQQSQRKASGSKVPQSADGTDPGKKPGTTNPQVDPDRTPVTNPDDLQQGDGLSGDACEAFSDKLAGAINTSGSAKVPIIGSINFNLKGNAQFSVDVSPQIVSVGLNATITSFTPSLARSVADNVINSYKDPLKLTPVPASELKNFYASTPGWQGLDCLVIPIKKVSNTAYEYEFEPALPMVVSAKASTQALAAKLGGGLNFTGITSKVIRHFQPESVAKRGTYKGTAAIIAKGDTYSINYNFGTAAPSALATPMAGIEYGMNGGNGTYKSITVTSFVADDSKIDLKLTK